MQGSEQLIAIYHAGFIICMCLAGVFAALSIFFFFKFKIRQVFDFLTGRAQRRTVRQMEEENAKTGKLREDYYSASTSSDLDQTQSGSISETGKAPTEKMMTGSSPTEKTGVHPAGASEGDAETTLLNSGSDETTLLNSGDSETTLLTPAMESELRSQEGETEDLLPIGRFEITKEIMEVHTNEII